MVVGGSTGSVFVFLFLSLAGGWGPPKKKESERYRST